MVWKDALRDSLQSPLKIQGPNQNFDKVIKILVFRCPFLAELPPRVLMHGSGAEYTVTVLSTQ
jgi:hypothetical protein